MLSVIGSPLVAGSTGNAMSETQSIRVERAFFMGKEVQPVGAIIEVPKHFAAGMIAAGKASAVDKPVPLIEEPSAPAEREVTAPQPKGKKHARKQW